MQIHVSFESVSSERYTLLSGFFTGGSTTCRYMHHLSRCPAKGTRCSLAFLLVEEHHVDTCTI